MSQYRNALFALYDLTIEIDMPYLNILRYIILNILRYCVLIDNISIFCPLPYLLCGDLMVKMTLLHVFFSLLTPFEAFQSMS